MARAKHAKSNAKYHMLVSNTPHIKVVLKNMEPFLFLSHIQKGIFSTFVHNLF
jgi:hypothetical protein